MSQSEYKLALSPRTEADADPAVAALLSKTKASLGMIPNMYANMANAPALLETYVFGYNSFRSKSGLNAAEQETVLLAISQFNGCSYCMAAHSALADMNQVPTEVTDALRAGESLPDLRLDALASFTRVMVRTRGLPSVSDVNAFKSAGFTESHILHIILAIAVKTISNYSNHLFHTKVDEIFSARSWDG